MVAASGISLISSVFLPQLRKAARKPSSGGLWLKHSSGSQNSRSIHRGSLVAAFCVRSGQSPLKHGFTSKDTDRIRQGHEFLAAPAHPCPAANARVLLVGRSYCFSAT